jgi:hypothetical protein
VKETTLHHAGMQWNGGFASSIFLLCESMNDSGGLCADKNNLLNL